MVFRFFNHNIGEIQCSIVEGEGLIVKRTVTTITHLEFEVWSPTPPPWARVSCTLRVVRYREALLFAEIIKKHDNNRDVRFTFWYYLLTNLHIATGT